MVVGGSASSKGASIAAAAGFVVVASSLLAGVLVAGSLLLLDVEVAAAAGFTTISSSLPGTSDGAATVAGSKSIDNASPSVSSVGGIRSSRTNAGDGCKILWWKKWLFAELDGGL